MSEEAKPSKHRPVAIGIAAAVGLGTFYLMRKRVRACVDLPEIWSPQGPLHLTDDAYNRARIYIAKFLYRNHMYSGSPREKPAYDSAKFLVDVANHLQECKWEELESARATQVYEGLASMIRTMERDMKEDPNAFFSRHGL